MIKKSLNELNFKLKIKFQYKILRKKRIYKIINIIKKKVYK